jgi:macrolide-specific efflux system membrane fusion protein
MDGTVVSVEARPGQTLVATYQTVQLLRIADLSVMTVWTQVAEADVPKLRIGMPVWFTTLGHEGRKWEGRVRAILPGPYRAGGNKDGGQAGGNAVVFYTALFDIPNPGNELRPDMSAQTFFVTRQAANVLNVPVSATFPASGEADADQVSVRILTEDGAPQTRTIRIGVRTRFRAEVVEGLAEDERIVTGEKLQEDGMKIRFSL